MKGSGCQWGEQAGKPTQSWRVFPGSAKARESDKEDDTADCYPPTGFALWPKQCNKWCQSAEIFIETLLGYDTRTLAPGNSFFKIHNFPPLYQKYQKYKSVELGYQLIRLHRYGAVSIEFQSKYDPVTQTLLIRLHINIAQYRPNFVYASSQLLNVRIVQCTTGQGPQSLKCCNNRF